VLHPEIPDQANHCVMLLWVLRSLGLEGPWDVRHYAHLLRVQLPSPNDTLQFQEYDLHGNAAWEVREYTLDMSLEKVLQEDSDISPVHGYGENLQVRN